MSCISFQELYVANFTSLYELFRIAINDSAGLLQNVIDDFCGFRIDHRVRFKANNRFLKSIFKVTLFKNFVTKFSMIEWVYYSTRIFKGSTNM